MKSNKKQKLWGNMMKAVLFVVALLWQEVYCLHQMNLGGDPALQDTDLLRRGHCPKKPGDLKSKLSEDFDMSKLEGVWRTIYDEKDLNGKYACQTVRLTAADPGDFDETAEQGSKPRVFLDQANGYPQSQRQKLKDAEHKASSEPYSVHSGLHLHFRHASDPTIAYLESSMVMPWNFLDPVPPERFKNAR